MLAGRGGRRWPRRLEKKRRASSARSAPARNAARRGWGWTGGAAYARCAARTLLAEPVWSAAWTQLRGYRGGRVGARRQTDTAYGIDAEPHDRCQRGAVLEAINVPTSCPGGGAERGPTRRALGRMHVQVPRRRRSTSTWFPWQGAGRLRGRVDPRSRGRGQRRDVGGGGRRLAGVEITGFRGRGWSSPSMCHRDMPCQSEPRLADHQDLGSFWVPKGNGGRFAGCPKQTWRTDDHGKARRGGESRRSGCGGNTWSASSSAVRSERRAGRCTGHYVQLRGAQRQGAAVHHLADARPSAFLAATSWPPITRPGVGR